MASAPQIDREVLFSQQFLINSLRRFLPAAILLTCMIYLSYSSTSSIGRSIIEESEARQLRQCKQLISDTFQHLHSDLRVLSNHPEVAAFISDPSPENAKAVADVFEVVMSVSKTYDQIRVIDSEGRESIRVRLLGDETIVTPPPDLRDVSKEYYFSDAYALTKSQIFVSALDLNTVSGVVENPPKPTIRVATPLYDKAGTKKGILILNYLGYNLLSKLDRMDDQYGHGVMLVNREGYWLKGPDPEDAWGFMYKDRLLDTYQNSFFEEWHQVASYVSGQFYSDTGLVTYDTVYPLKELANYDSVGEHRLGWLKSRQYFWKLVSHIDQKRIRHITSQSRHSAIGLLVLAIILIAAAAGELAYTKAKRAA